VAYNRGLWTKRALEEDHTICSLRALAASLIDSADARQPKGETFQNLPDYQRVLRAALKYCNAAPPMICNLEQVLHQSVCMYHKPPGSVQFTFLLRGNHTSDAFKL